MEMSSLNTINLSPEHLGVPIANPVPLAGSSKL